MRIEEEDCTENPSKAEMDIQNFCFYISGVKVTGEIAVIKNSSSIPLDFRSNATVERAWRYNPLPPAQNNKEEMERV